VDKNLIITRSAYRLNQQSENNLSLFKTLEGMERKYTLMRSGWKSPPVRGNVHHGNNHELDHLEPYPIFRKLEE